MKSYNHLFELLIDRDNIKLAIRRACRRKKKRPEVRYIYNHIEKFVERIRNFLISDMFTPQTHELTKRYDKSSRKERFTIQPYFWKNQYGEEVFEQIIHHAVIQVLKPILMKGMYQYSCGAIPNRGGHYGKRYLARYIREHNKADIKYGCKLDIHHFYENIDIELVKERFRKIIHDEKFLKIIITMVDSNIAFYGDVIFDKGFRIGTYFAQWFANWFLQDLDHHIKEQLHIKCYVRYVDDMVLFHPNKRKIHDAFYSIRDFLVDYKLEIKSNWQVFKFDFVDKKGNVVGRPIDFMGFKFYRNRTTLRKRNIKNSTRKARKLDGKEKINAYEASQMLSYTGLYHSTNTYRYFEKEIKSRVNFKKCKRSISIRQKIKNKEI